MEIWTENVVDRMAALKLTGMPFEAAWSLTLREYPPRSRDMGPAMPLLFGGMEEESLVDFFRRACEDAWWGRRPELQHLATALVDVGRDVVVVAPRGASRQALPAAA